MEEKRIFTFNSKKKRSLKEEKLKAFNFLQRTIYPGICIEYIDTSKDKTVLICISTKNITIDMIMDQYFRDRFRHKLIDILRIGTTGDDYISLPKMPDIDDRVYSLMEAILKRRDPISYIKSIFLEDLIKAYNELNKYMLSELYNNFIK